MLVQSGGGKVYAILADSADFEVGIMPTLHLASTTVMLTLRFRFKARTSEVLDPMLLPKKGLSSGIEQSKNTVRGTLIMSTGFTVEKLGLGSADIITEKAQAGLTDYILTPTGDESVPLSKANIRDDFVADFPQLVLSALAPIYPPKNFSKAPVTMSAFEFGLYMEGVSDATPDSPFQTVEGGKGADVKKVNLKGGDDEPKKPLENEGVDKDTNVQPMIDPKIKVFGQAPKEDEPADH